MASAAWSKRRFQNKPCKIQWSSLKEPEEGTAPKDVPTAFDIPSINLFFWGGSFQRQKKSMKNSFHMI